MLQDMIDDIMNELLIRGCLDELDVKQYTSGKRILDLRMCRGALF
jgi:hypothetical protein